MASEIYTLAASENRLSASTVSCKTRASPLDQNLLKIRTGHEKPGKQWNFVISFPGQDSHEIELWVVESHEKVIYLLRMNRQKIKS